MPGVTDRNHCLKAPRGGQGVARFPFHRGDARSTVGHWRRGSVAGAGDSGEVRWRVFVSHTSELRDFPAGGSYVAAVERAISACGHVIVDMADFPAADLPAAELCRERVRSCDVYVGVLGTRYGSAVRDMPQVSYTELEFDTATEAGLPRLVFVLDTDAAAAGIPPSRLTDPESGARQEAFRRRVQASAGHAVVHRSGDAGATGGTLAARAGRAGAPGRGPAAAGRLLAEVTDPFALEVHRPVQPDERAARAAGAARRTWPASTTGSWPGWCGPRPRAPAGSRCWWAGPRRARPGRAGRRWACCGTSRSRGGCGIRSTRPARRRRCGSCPRSARGPWCG